MPSPPEYFVTRRHRPLPVGPLTFYLSADWRHVEWRFSFLSSNSTAGRKSRLERIDWPCWLWSRHIVELVRNQVLSTCRTIDFGAIIYTIQDIEMQIIGSDS